MRRSFLALFVCIFCGVAYAQKVPEFRWKDSKDMVSILRQKEVYRVLDVWVEDGGRFMLVLRRSEMGGVEVMLIDLKRKRVKRVGRTLLTADAMSVKAALFEWFSFWSFMWRPSNGVYMGHIEAVDANKNGLWDEGEMFRLKVLRVSNQKGRTVANSWTMPYFCYSNSGKRLFYTVTRKSGGRAEVVMASAGGGSGKRLYKAQKGRRIVFLEPSPDDRYLAIVEYVVDIGEPALVVISVKEKEVVLTQNISGLALTLPSQLLTWLPDSSGILLMRRGRVWRLDIKSGKLSEDLAMAGWIEQSLSARRIGVSFAPTQGDVTVVSVFAGGHEGCALLYAPSLGTPRRVKLMPGFAVTRLGRTTAVVKRKGERDFKVMLVPVKWRKVAAARRPPTKKKPKKVERSQKPSEEKEVCAPAACDLGEVVWEAPAVEVVGSLKVRVLCGMRVSFSGKHLLVLFGTAGGSRGAALFRLNNNAARLISKWSPCGVPYPAIEHGIVPSRMLQPWGERCFRKDDAVPYVEFKDANGNGTWDKGEVFVLGWMDVEGNKKPLLESRYFPWFDLDHRTGALYCVTRRAEDRTVRLVRLLNGEKSVVRRFGEDESPVLLKLSPDARLLAFSVVNRKNRSVTFCVLDLKTAKLVFEKQCGVVNADGSVGHEPLWTPDSRHVESTQGRCVVVEDVYTKEKQTLDYVKTIAESIGARRFEVLTKPAVFPQAMSLSVKPLDSKYRFSYAYDPVSKFLFRIPTRPAEEVLSFNPHYVVILKGAPHESIIVRKIKWRKPTRTELKECTIGE